MKRPDLIALLMAASALAADASPRVAIVRVKEIYTGLASTEALQQDTKKQNEEIWKDQRAKELNRMLEELKALQKQLSDKSQPLDEETARKLARNYEIKRQEALTLQKEFESFREEQEKEINRKMVAAMRDSLTRITETSQRIAREKGFDLLMDGSGNTNTGVPFVLYQKDAPDITEDVKAALKDLNPTPSKPQESAATAPAPASQPSSKPEKPNR
jgi:Skp family chaperone for outer membrane proteins